MAYVIGIDGGGTKTQGIVCDESWTVLADYTGGPSNHQYIPRESVRRNVEEVFRRLLGQAGLEVEDISYVCLGLAGNDSDQDCEMLTSLLQPVFGNIPYRVENDLWPAMSAVPEVSWGAVVICGTGFNMALRRPDGTTHTLRALEYEHGNLSATDQLMRDALHGAFCSEEHTGKKTALEDRIPELLQVPDMEGVLRLMLEMPEKLCAGEIVKEVFSLARSGDEVSQDILIRFGTSMGEMLGNFAKSYKMDRMELPVVLSGSILVKAVSRLHIDAMALAIRRYIPDFRFYFNENPPALGACRRALQAIKIK